MKFRTFYAMFCPFVTKKNKQTRNHKHENVEKDNEKQRLHSDFSVKIICIKLNFMKRFLSRLSCNNYMLPVIHRFLLCWFDRANRGLFPRNIRKLKAAIAVLHVNEISTWNHDENLRLSTHFMFNLARLPVKISEHSLSKWRHLCLLSLHLI